jgi:hypothetical protein
MLEPDRTYEPRYTFGGEDRAIYVDGSLDDSPSALGTSAKREPSRTGGPVCELCGTGENLRRTECCGHWICDDLSKYILFSYARNSCTRNHQQFTLCGYHHYNDHKGNWKECKSCRDSFDTEMYVWYGTNEYTFEKLENPPAYDPTICAGCNRVVVLYEDGYVYLNDIVFCDECCDALRDRAVQDAPRIIDLK